ncbi:hypothetical protein B5M42_006995 [Paenibacillus athensensis]|uniref:Uncharacterized protein n=1 Tax=Paenibacillus athensensis TaxID=1967502 RepID=A0A4Y8Q0D4_9BACL|nr:hypothetical protein [Paenibacillus athensensis]MCD1258579.1 hypothetical protein [Paenibacillus athensensis]
MGFTLSTEAQWLLALGSALFWTMAYVLLILKGFRDRTCGMPLAALCANLAWELLWAFILPFHPVQQIVTVIWLALDGVILLQLLRYSQNGLSPRTLRITVGALFAIALLLHVGTAVELHDPQGKYSAFAINLMMSLLFIRMALIRGRFGQSLGIAWTKMLGTLCASLWSYSLYPHSVLLNMLYVLIAAADGTYILLLHKDATRVVPTKKKKNRPSDFTFL